MQSREPRRLKVTLLSHAKAAVRGRLEAMGEGAGPTAAPRPFALEAANEPLELELTLAPPKSLKPGRDTLRLAAVLEDGRRFDLAVPVVDYPHIRATPRPVPARVAVQTADLRLPPLKRVGYVRGASDRVPEFLRQVGVPLEMLGRRAARAGDLGRYDAIVIGSRAYEIDPALVRANRRLLDYVRNGGLLIVQYQQAGVLRGQARPLPARDGPAADRVTDETAAVTLLDPASPVFNAPNKIGAADWEGWVQERGLYFAHTWDPAYKPLLVDEGPGHRGPPGEPAGGRVGKGVYVYTGLALFRQLPAGVPGAYRLFANLLALRGAAEVRSRTDHEQDPPRAAALALASSPRRELRRRPDAAGRLLPPWPRPPHADGEELRGEAPGRSTSAGSTWARRRSTTGSAPRRPTRRPTSGSAGRRRSSPAAPPRGCSLPTGPAGPTPSRRRAAAAGDLYFGSYRTAPVLVYNSKAVKPRGGPAPTGTTCSTRAGRGRS